MSVECLFSMTLLLGLDWAGNFAHMMGADDEGAAEVLRLYMTLHADHEGGNVSAHATHLVVRPAGSSSPARHRVPFNSRNEVPIALNDVGEQHPPGPTSWALRWPTRICAWPPA